MNSTVKFQDIEVRIEGTTGLLMNRFTDAQQLDATNGSRSSAAAADRGTPAEQAEEVMYLDESGAPVIPTPNLFKCIMEGGRFFKAGRSKITTQKTSLIAGCLSIYPSIAIPLEYEKPWVVDGRAIRNPATGGRMLRYRPCFHEWALNFTLTLMTSEISAKLMREIIDKSSFAIGLGDFRPDCKGPFGKFKVTLWKPL